MYVTWKSFKEDQKSKMQNQNDNCSEEVEEEPENDEHSEKKRIWEREQEELKVQLKLYDTEKWTKNREMPTYLGGVDISFVKGDNVNACAAFVVVEYPDLKVIHKDLSMIKLSAPYIPGFLAFREVEFLVSKVEALREVSPEKMPQVIMVDGNGIIHPKGFGLACHLGVLVDIPTIGCAKTLYQIDGMEKNEAHKEKIKTLTKGGDSFPLIGDSGKQHGWALRSNDNAPNPIYISPGHKISMESSKWLVSQCCPNRVPEPVRQADILSREYLREKWKPEES